MKKKHLETLILGAVVFLVLTGSIFTANTKSDFESNFRKSYVFQNYLKDDDIQIRNENGVITLTGSVSDEYHGRLAADFFQDMHGVKRVENQLTVSCQIPERNSDGWYRTRLNSMLSLHKDWDAKNTQIDVKDGRVTIRGEAANQEAKDRLTEFIRKTEGIKDIDNQMTLATKSRKTHSENVDDASIHAQAHLALSYCAPNFSGYGSETSGTMDIGQTGQTSQMGQTGSTMGSHPSEFNLKVKNGVVTVSGNTNNTSEKEWITRCLENVHGVRRVNNRITIGNTGEYHKTRHSGEEKKY